MSPCVAPASRTEVDIGHQLLSGRFSSAIQLMKMRAFDTESFCCHPGCRRGSSAYAREQGGGQGLIGSGLLAQTSRPFVVQGDWSWSRVSGSVFLGVKRNAPACHTDLTRGVGGSVMNQYGILERKRRQNIL